MPQLQPGQPVPDFTLTAGSGESVTLSQFRGKYVVLYFYPKDMTPTCTEESCQFRDYNGQFETLNTEVIGISPDDLKSHAKFAAKYELPFLLLSDPDHTVCELFGVWQMKKMYGREYMGVVRSTFIVDPQGKLVREWRGVRIKGHVEQVLEAVKAAQAGVGTL
ncbi:thioredoxin-dependent thiol peroxidase [Paenibacillus ehimensis]|uniref:thioredoxin-dependent peroxiredoxin n=1 Tax=Paenibacillus ehimensis TaxID=79264 RepID=A0ABT8VL27_9BACL|nr:thioredoxin-dependent thiol peroxidase [Paenibacillus ehimensis]MDO3681683.1 thioredoxin-dependent thiol peroxidase [Paenibacillus ehimensis]MEC0208940.1 thioredoxin-dependent thiol peroxidase [Paenibacillus ehimensis]